MCNGVTFNAALLSVLSCSTSQATDPTVGEAERLTGAGGGGGGGWGAVAENTEF